MTRKFFDSYGSIFKVCSWGDKIKGHSRGLVIGEQSLWPRRPSSGMHCWVYRRLDKPRRGNLDSCCVDCDTHFEGFEYGKLKNAQDMKGKLSSDIKDDVDQKRGSHAISCL